MHARNYWKSQVNNNHDNITIYSPKTQHYCWIIYHSAPTNCLSIGCICLGNVCCRLYLGCFKVARLEKNLCFFYLSLFWKVLARGQRPRIPGFGLGGCKAPQTLQWKSLPIHISSHALLLLSRNCSITTNSSWWWPVLGESLENNGWVHKNAVH